MGFEFTGKVALITGGASGIGLAYTKSLLKNGVKGVAIVDINAENGAKVQKELGDKTIFIQTNVTKKDELESAFKETIAKFGHLDIVLNNAGIVCEDRWEFEVSLNVNAVIQGVLFGLQYMRKDKGGRGGVILNTSSVAGLEPISLCPVYAGTKACVIHFGRSIGTEFYYKDTGVKVFTLCPGKVDTPIVNTLTFLEGFDHSVLLKPEGKLGMQTPEYIGECMIEIVKRAENGSCWIVNDNLPPFEYEFSKQTFL